MQRKKIIIGALILGIGAFLGYFLYKLYGSVNEQLGVTHATQTSPEIKGAVFVDMIRVREESEPFKTLNAFLENRNSESQQQIFNFENELRQEDKELRDKEKHSETPSEDLLHQRQEFDKKVAELAQIALEKKNTLSAQFNEMRVRIEAKLNTVIEEMAKEMKASFVFNRSLGQDAHLVLFGSHDLDITDKVIETLNAAHAELNLDID